MYGYELYMKVLLVLDVMLSDNAIIMSMIIMELIQLQSLYYYCYVLMCVYMYICICVYVEILFPLSLRLTPRNQHFTGKD